MSGAVRTRAEPRPSREARPTGRDLRRSEIAAEMLRPVEKLLGNGRGFTEVTVAEIIEAAGVKRSTFYYHFHDKAELLVEISARAISEIVEASRGLYRLDPDSSFEAFEARVNDTVETWVPHIPLMGALAELAAYDARVRDQFDAGWEAARDAAEQHIVDGQRAGFVRPDADPVYTSAWLTWMAERGMGQVVAKAPGEDLERVVRAISQIVWRSLYARDQGAG